MRTSADILAHAFALHQSGKLQEAEAVYRRVLDEDQMNAKAAHLLGVLLHQTGRHAEGAQYVEAAIRLDPNDAEAHNNLGVIYHQLGRNADAAIHHQRALELSPNLAEAHSNLGLCLRAEGELEKAAACYRRAIELNPDFVEAYFQLGSILSTSGNDGGAVASFRQALQRNPRSTAVLINLGNCLMRLGEVNEASECYDRALALAPFHVKGHTNRSQAHLLKGDFAKGWEEHEWRLETGVIPWQSIEQPRWQGENLEGKTVLLHAEQGFGDTLQFIRYVPMVKSCSAKVIVCCQRPLLKLLGRCAEIDLLIGDGTEFPPFDVYSPLLSLPWIFKTSIDTIPASAPYLSADPGLVAQWKDKLAVYQGMRIGINWHGRPGAGHFSRRNIPLTNFKQLASVPGVQLVSLQKGEGREELKAALSQGLPIIDLGDDVDSAHGAFMDTAAIMMNLDLVITSDTALPHLAGALGVPVWLALPFVPDWRWLLGRSDSPWYPTMRLFRQERAGDWAGVFERIECALRGIAGVR